jgi:phosphatidylserine/phosphatidylglycerophosphate/cardiolipin synthase-like enzyme
VTARFPAAARAAVLGLAQSHLEVLADRLAVGAPRAAVVGAVPLPGYGELAGAVCDALAADGLGPAGAAAWLRALAEGYRLGRAEQSVDGVWSGPSSSHVPTRATAQVLVDLVAEAQHELVLMTYSAGRHLPLREALVAAAGRGVQVTAVVETLAGARGALQGEEPAAAFVSTPGVQVWHWPVQARAETTSKMHAKLAVADRRVLFVTSANLTQAGIGKNIEAGLLVRGGSAPLRACEHVRELQARGLLARLMK